MAKSKGRMAKEKARADDNPFLEFAGALLDPTPAPDGLGSLGTFPGGVDEINAWVRELRDDETKPSDQKAPQVKNSDASG